MDFVISTEVLDTAIEDARNKKQKIASEMNYMTRLVSEVQLMEKAAEKAKQEFDNCNLVILEEIDELIFAQQEAKEANDKRAREVYAQKINIATEMSEIQFRVSDVLKGGDGCVASIAEMCELLEKRLTSAITEKEVVDKERLKIEVALAYQKSQMEKLAQESNKLEQEAKENLKFQEFLVDRRRVVNMLLDEIANNCQDVHLLKMELGIPQDESETAEDYLRPIMQEMARMQDCEWWEKDSELTQEPTDLHIDQMDKNKRNRNGPDLKYAYNKSKIKKLEKELKKLQRKAMEDVKLHEFLLMEEELEDYQNEIEKLVNEDYLKPIMPMHDFECYKGGNGRVVAGREEKRTNNIVDSLVNDSEILQELADSYTRQLNKSKSARNESNPKHAYQKSETEKLVEVSKNSLKVQESLVECGHVINLTEEDIFCDANPIEDYLDEIAKLVTGDTIFKVGIVM